jgi:uncharacterized membrane protein (UPF0127 family)
MDTALPFASTALRVLRADSFRSRLLGLLALPRLQPGEALVLKPCASVHTFFMGYAIDVVYLDRDDRVIKVVPALAPWRASACLGARATLELAAGEAERLQLRPGLRIGAD